MARDRDEEEDDEDDEELELVMFKGSLNGVEPNMRKNTRLVEAGLLPAKKLVSDAISRRAETIVVEPQGNAARVKLEVDGIAYPGPRLGKQHALAVTQVLKLLAGLDIAERKRPQKGGMKADYEGKPFLVNIATEPIAGGAERLVIRTRAADQEHLKPDEIGFSKGLRERVRELTSGRNGLLLACGPPHSGVTTTAQTGLLRSIDVYVSSVVTIADMGGREITNIPPFEADEGDDLEETLARIIRADHDIVFVDPIRDAETLKSLCKRAEDICVVAEFAARDTATGIAQLVQWVGPELVCERVKGVVSARLIRRLCSKCKFAYRPPKQLLAKLGLPADTKVLYKPRPPLEEEEEDDDLCSKCGGLNYLGRIGMFELLEVTDKVKEAIRAGADPAAIRKVAREEDQITLQKDGLRLVKEGITSLEELQRIFKPAGAAKKKVRRRPPA